VDSASLTGVYMNALSACSSGGSRNPDAAASRHSDYFIGFFSLQNARFNFRYYWCVIHIRIFEV